MTTLRAAAVWYARLGFSVVPEVDKRPQVRTIPLRDSPATPEQVDRWWAEHPDHNVGILTGRPSGVIVLDADDDDAIAMIVASLPFTPWQVTSGRGRHFGFAYPGCEVKTRTRIGCSAKPDGDHGGCYAGGAWCRIDLLGDGGKATMPPSVHKSGRIYTWLHRWWECDALPAFDPRWIPPPRPPIVYPDAPSDDPEHLIERARKWMARRDPAVAGQAGDIHTSRTVWALRRMGLDRASAWALLTAWNSTCSPPWSDRELAIKVDRAWRI